MSEQRAAKLAIRASIEADVKKDRERKAKIEELGEDAVVKQEEDLMEADEEDPVPYITIEVSFALSPSIARKQISDLFFSFSRAAL